VPFFILLGLDDDGNGSPLIQLGSQRIRGSMIMNHAYKHIIGARHLAETLNALVMAPAGWQLSSLQTMPSSAMNDGAR
jgi:hypothetical protein